MANMRKNMLSVAKSGHPIDNNEEIRKQFIEMMHREPTDRDLEIQELVRKEYEEYKIKRDKFYTDQLHWTNNKRRRFGLHPLRGKVNKYRQKNFHSFQSSAVFYYIEDLIAEVLPKKIDENFGKFVDVKDLAIGDKNTFYVS